MDIIGTHSSLDGFFHDLLDDALQTERVEIAVSSRAYLVQLFQEFSRTEGLHRATGHDDTGAPTLAWLYERAHSGAPSQRFDAWRHLGDVALMVAGLFGAYIERRRSLVGVDYYVQMGAGAYGSAASFSYPSGIGLVLEELARKFRHLVDVLTRVGEATTLPVATGIERLYERWMANPGQEDLLERLGRLGAAPVLVGSGDA